MDTQLGTSVLTWSVFFFSAVSLQCVAAAARVLTRVF
jgi:hypothetical protein